MNMFFSILACSLPTDSSHQDDSTVPAIPPGLEDYACPEEGVLQVEVEGLPVMATCSPTGEDCWSSEWTIHGGLAHVVCDPGWLVRVGWVR